MDAQETVEQAEQLLRSATDDPTAQEWSAADPEGTHSPETDGESGPVPIQNLTPGEVVSLIQTPYVVVWGHELTEPDRFSQGVAQVLPNGVLLITRPMSGVPVKGYAPGAWREFEHVGEQYHTTPARQPKPKANRPVDTSYRTDPALLYPQPDRAPGNSPWTQEHSREPELANGDTQDIPTVQESRQEVQPRPKAAGADGAPRRTAGPDLPGSGDPDPEPGVWKALWRSLTRGPEDQ